MSAWRVRKEGSHEIYTIPSANVITAGLRDGNFLTTDEVLGPDDSEWMPIENHPHFSEEAQDIEPEPGESVDDTHLDMNPLIDVCLVLLIFFILTITYASLERTVSIPEDSAEEKGALKQDINDIKDRVFIVMVRMEGDHPAIKMGVHGAMKEVPLERIYSEMQELISSTGRKEMVLDIDKWVPWGIETAILDAATGNKVHNIINNQRDR